MTRKYAYLLIILVYWAFLPPARAACNSPAGNEVTVTINGPDFIGVGCSETFTAAATELTSTGTEIPVSGGEFIWTVTQNPSKVSSPPTGSSPTFTASGIQASAALNDVTLHVEYTPPSGYKGPCSADQIITVIKVEFNKDPVKVGIGANRTSETPAYPATTPVTYPHRLIATITPKDAATAVTFDSSSVARATVSEVSRTDVGDTKQVVLQVTGVTKTPVTSPGGDAEIRALLNANQCSSIKAIVVAPDHIAKPYPQANGNVTPVNMVEDATTSPAVWGMPPGKVELWTEYLHWLTVTVHDQFNNPLDIYAGASITEGGNPLNQELSNNSTYQDPVGMARRPAVYYVDANSQEAQAWPTESPLPLVNAETVIQNIDVEVDGVSLSPAVVNRKIIVTPPDHIQIIWQ